MKKIDTLITMDHQTTNSNRHDKVIAVIGASGGSGQAFVRAALAHGYTVRAGTHTRPMAEAEGLTVVKCNATVPDDIARLLQGSTAVVSLIGHVKGSPASVQSDAMRIIIEQMKLQGIRRIVSLTGTGVRLPGDTPSLLDKLANSAISFIDPARIEDGIQHAKLLQDSELDWVLLRVLKLTNGGSSPFSLSEHGPAKIFTSREEVAESIVQLLESDKWTRCAPVVSRPIL